MSILIKILRKEASIKIAKGILLLLASFVISVFLMPAGIFVMFAGFIGASIYTYSSIGNIPCPKCHNPYGVGISFMGSIQVPPKCVCCHEEAS